MMRDPRSAARPLDVVLRVGYRDLDDGPDYLTDLDEDGFFLRTARTLAVGEELKLTLSFPGLLAPCDVTGVVVALSAPDAHSPDAPLGAMIDVAPADDHEAGALERMRARLDQQAPLPKTPFRVLLVEDNHFAHKLFHHAVRRSQYEWRHGGALQIISVGDAGEGLDVLASSPIDLAIVGYFLPSITGGEMIRHIRRDPRWTHLPVLVISVGGDGVREEALAAGADLYLDKPVLLKQLLNTLHLLIGAPLRAGAVDEAP
jgi:CheY-like chemotaxis protein